MAVSSMEDCSRLALIYRGPGANRECVDFTTKLLKKNLPDQSFFSEATDLSTIFKNRVSGRTIVVIPGGNACEQAMSKHPHHMDCSYAFNRFLGEGGNVHATCAGAILLSSGIKTQFDSFPPQKTIFTETEILLKATWGTAVIPMIHHASARPREKMYYADIQLADHASFPESLRGRTVRFTDADSPGWTDVQDAVVLGWYTGVHDESMPAILSKEYGKWKLWMQGPHLEFFLTDDPSYTGSETLTEEEKALRLEVFYHSFRTLGLKV